MDVYTATVWGVLLGVVGVYVLYRVLHLRKKAVQPYPFDEGVRPWILLSVPPGRENSPFVVYVKRLAIRYGVPVKEIKPEQSPYPVPRSVPSLVFQGKYMWATEHTLDKERVRVSLERAMISWRNHVRNMRSSLSRGTVVLSTGLFSTHGAEFYDDYVSASFVDADDIYVDEDGSVETDSVGLPYHPYMEEALRIFSGGSVRDLRSLSPVREFVYITRPHHVEEQL